MPIAQQLIINGIYAFLTTAIGSSLSNRIWHTQAPQDETHPLCIFQIVSDTPQYLFVKEIEDIDVQIDLWGKFEDNGVNALTTIGDTLIEYIDNRANKVYADGNSFSVMIINKGIINIIENDVNIQIQLNLS